jgi:general secretion pathway protein H
MARIEMCRAGQTHAAANGFTLIELLVVLALLAAMVGLAVPAFDRVMPGASLKSEAGKVAGILREARSEAIRDDADVAVTLDIGDRAVSMPGRRHHLPEPLGMTMLTGSTEVTRGGARIIFYGDGTSTGGRVRLLAKEKHVDVLVDWLTGRVAIAE